jgi:GMP synthase (glutamine-hydrolysing)
VAHPKTLLVALREPTDPMCAHARACFAARAQVPLDNVHVHSMIEGRPAKGVLSRYDAVFFGGSGAFSVLDDIQWIRDGLTTLQEVAASGQKAWASCFGFQGLSLALGAEVRHDESLTEMGSTLLHLTDAGRADLVLGVLPDPFWAQEGHHDHVMTQPPGTTLLATGSQVRMQAFKLDGVPFYASQFHPELTVDATVARFRHYQEHYVDAGSEEVLQALQSGADTPEMGQVLARLVRL